MLIAGTAVGVVLPVMPLLVHELGITQAQFGMVVSSFGLAKLIANVPAAVGVAVLPCPPSRCPSRTPPACRSPPSSAVCELLHES